jgi:type VI protein secretion system component Hcp
MNVCNLLSHVQQTDLSEAKQGRRKASGDEGRKVGSSTLETLKLSFKVVKMTHNKEPQQTKHSRDEQTKKGQSRTLSR